MFMSESILSGKAGIFPCPSCGQMIYSDANMCRFFSIAVDHQAATVGAEIQSRVNTAYIERVNEGYAFSQTGI